MQRQRDRERQRETETDRERETETERGRERQREREEEGEEGIIYIKQLLSPQPYQTRGHRVDTYISGQHRAVHPIKICIF